ncbi:MAG: DNA polymerase III subunit gamma/tau, partial [Dehalococcoidia bacterium]
MTASQVLYRKWRPQTLADVVGQEPVTQTLLNALATGRVAHAYLFCGPRGTGKTSTGRIMAKAVNCLSNGKGEPCNTCSMCQAITDGRALDLIEIDGASNRGIDDIRDIREKINFAPNAARYKVYIIDEVHMLTEPAFNALLKTLEEPPPHAIFVLATTEVHKVPLTILSRCQRFDFRRLRQAVVVNKLQQICDQEAMSIEPQALPLIAKAATGSLRDAENLLEQLVLHHGSDISIEQVRTELGISEDVRVRQLAEHILCNDLSAGLETINSLAADGLDLLQVSRSLVEYLRRLLLIKADATQIAELPAEAAAEMKLLVTGKSLEELSRAIKLFAQIDFRTDPQSTLPLELALVDCSLTAQAKRKETIKEAMSEEPEAPAPSRNEDKVHATEPVQEQASVEFLAETPTPPSEVAETSIPPSPHSVEYIREHWNEFVSACRG